MHKVRTSRHQAADAGWLVKAIERMMRPLARLLVGRVSCNVAVDLLKQLYVQEAKRTLKTREPDKRITKSSLALLTGLDTRAIAALEDAKTDYSIVDMCPEAAVLSVWATDSMFRDPNSGQPLELPIYGRGLSFQTLVTRTVGRNVTCPTVLEKLTESGNIEIVNENFVRLKERFYVPVKESDRTFIEAGSFSVNRLMETVIHNMASSSNAADRWLQQDRWTMKLPPERIQQFRKDLRALFEHHIKQAEAAVEPYEAPVRRDNHFSAGVGWYYWEKPPEESD